MNYNSYDELSSVVDEFRNKHPELTRQEQDRMIKKLFCIDRTVIREMDGVADVIQFGGLPDQQN